MSFHSQGQAIKNSLQVNTAPTHSNYYKYNSKVSPFEINELAANFQHSMFIQDHYDIKTKVKYYGAQMEESECVTPEKTKSMLIQPQAMVNTKPKKKTLQEEDRFQTPPRRPQKLTLEELDLMMKQRRLLERKMYDFRFN